MYIDNKKAYVGYELYKKALPKLASFSLTSTLIEFVYPAPSHPTFI
jgi:hypothetical protein